MYKPENVMSVPKYQPLTLVLVEDDSVTRRMTQKMLAAQFGCRVETLCTGERVVGAVCRGDYDLLFLDCMLPGMNGLEITHAIRSLAGEKATIHIIGVTAMGQAACLAAGMSNWIGKPAGVEAYKMALIRWVTPEVSRVPSLGNRPEG